MAVARSEERYHRFFGGGKGAGFIMINEGERFINIVSYHLAWSAVRHSIVNQSVEVG